MKQLLSRRLTIGQRMMAGILTLLIFFVISATVGYFTLSKNQKIIGYSTDVVTPSVEGLNEFKRIVVESKMLTVSWVHLSKRVEEKNLLRVMHTREFPAIRKDLDILKRKWANESNIASLDSAMGIYSQVLEQQDIIMSRLLVREDDYEDHFGKLDEAQKLLDNSIIPKSNLLSEQLSRLIESKISEKKESFNHLNNSASNLKKYFIIVVLLLMFSSLTMTLLVSRTFTRPILEINQVLDELGQGKIPDFYTNKFKVFEINEISKNLNRLIDSLRQTSNFALKIGSGNYNSEFIPIGKDDVLGNSLISMRDSLAKAYATDRDRTWVSQGLAEFSEVLRNSGNIHIDELSQRMILHIVKYMNANQGGVFLLSSDSIIGNEYLHLISTYAWDKPRYLENQIAKGQGLVGQVWQERKSIYMDDLPQNYYKITSGLGKANPTSCLLVPIIYKDEFFGVIELGLFHKIKPFQIEFLEKVAEGFGGTISSIQVNERTQKLLKESQQLTEQLRAQEEEMRQNMEELQTTQEASEIKSRELEVQLAAIDKSVAKIEMDGQGFITDVNPKYLELSEYERDDIIHKNHKELLIKGHESSKTYIKMWEDLYKGIPVEGEFERLTKSGKSFWIRGSYFPVVDTSGKLIKVINLVSDITEDVNQFQTVKKERDQLLLSSSQLSSETISLKKSEEKARKERAIYEEINTELKDKLSQLQQQVHSFQEQLATYKLYKKQVEELKANIAELKHREIAQIKELREVRLELRKYRNTDS